MIIENPVQLLKCEFDSSLSLKCNLAKMKINENKSYGDLYSLIHLNIKLNVSLQTKMPYCFTVR